VLCLGRKWGAKREPPGEGSNVNDVGRGGKVGDNSKKGNRRFEPKAESVRLRLVQRHWETKVSLRRYSEERTKTKQRGALMGK